MDFTSQGLMSTMVMITWLVLLVQISSVHGARRIRSLEELDQARTRRDTSSNDVENQMNLTGSRSRSTRSLDAILDQLDVLQQASMGVEAKDKIVSAQGNRKQKFKQTYKGYEIYNTAINVEEEADGSTKIVFVDIFDDLESDMREMFNCDNQLSNTAAQAITLSLFGLASATVMRTSFTDIIYVDDDHVAHFTTNVDMSVFPENDDGPRRLHAMIDKCSKTILKFYEYRGFTTPLIVNISSDISTDSVRLHTSLEINKRSVDADCDIVAIAGNPKRPIRFGPGGDFCLRPLKRSSLVLASLCSLENDYTKGFDSAINRIVNMPASFVCSQGYDDARNGGFSPMLDAFYFVTRTAQLLMERYNIKSVPVSNPTPRANAHYRFEYEGAFWDGRDLYFGDGKDPRTYPYTTTDVVAHEYGHGFTDRRANLAYANQSGAINEAFSDMLGQVVEEHLFGRTDWLVGGELFKKPYTAQRFFENPPSDRVSIMHVNDYQTGMDVHFSSGVYNHVFWRISQRLHGAGHGLWPFLIANQLYWSEAATFESGACGTMRGAYDAGIDLETVAYAFKAVGIKLQECPEISKFVTAEMKAGIEQQGMTVSKVRKPLFRVVVPADATNMTVRVTSRSDVHIVIRTAYKRFSTSLADGAGSVSANVTGRSEVFVQFYLKVDNVELKNVSAIVTFS